MQYKAIISDIDGTLVPVKMDALPSKRVKKAVQKATEKGVLFSLATGRPFHLVEYLVDDLLLKSPIIVDNGAAIYSADTRRSLYDAIIDNNRANKIVAIINSYHKPFHVSCTTDNLFKVTSLSPDLKVRKFVIHGLTPRETETIIKHLGDTFKNLQLIRTGAKEGKELLDIYVTDITASKQHAILKLAEILQIKTTEIIAIGDHYNDFPLFMACGLKIAMGNAVDDLKAIADYIAPSLEEDGVADVIEKFVLNKN
ncbi:MAG: HAD family hydrolase [Candidatus Levyibacteriota bacterium]